MSEELVIKTVYIYRDGGVAVLDQHGKQMPEFQGNFKDMEAKITEQIGKQKRLPEIHKHILYWRD